MRDDKRIVNEKILWDKLASNYDRQTAVYKKAYDLSVEIVKRVLKKTDRVLEIPAGPGLFH